MLSGIVLCNGVEFYRSVFQARLLTHQGTRRTRSLAHPYARENGRRTGMRSTSQPLLPRLGCVVERFTVYSINAVTWPGPPSPRNIASMAHRGRRGRAGAHVYVNLTCSCRLTVCGVPRIQSPGCMTWRLPHNHRCTSPPAAHWFRIVHTARVSGEGPRGARPGGNAGEIRHRVFRPLGPLPSPYIPGHFLSYYATNS